MDYLTHYKKEKIAMSDTISKYATLYEKIDDEAAADIFYRFLKVL